VSEVRIAAEPRSEFGKGAARRIRRAHKVPAVLYGHGGAPRHISLPGHELMLALKTSNPLFALDLDGHTELALARDIQRDPVKGHLEHVDLVVVERGEKVKVAVPVLVEGIVPPGNLLTHDLMELEVEAEATNIPQSIVLDVSALEVGADVAAKDLTLPAGVVLVTDPEALVISLTPAPTVDQLEAELAQAESDLGVVREVKAEEAPAQA
jgi:large subunit ribosomal protein L25